MSLIKADDAQFSEALKSNEKVIVKFYADWCGSCRLMAPKYKRLAENEAYSDVAFLDVNAEHSPGARKAAGVDNLPFFAAFKNGELVEGSSAGKIDFVEKLIEKVS
ncbi:MAG: thioredoxin family protein [Chitinophagales bacterium]